MGLLSTDRRLRVVLHKEIRPILKRDLFAPAHDLQRAVVAGLETCTQPELRLVPVFCTRRFQAAAPGLIPVAHPPDLAVATSVNDPIMFTRSCHSPSPV